jgi:hypothetical protein
MDDTLVCLAKPILFQEKGLMWFDVPMKLEVFAQADSVAA